MSWVPIALALLLAAAPAASAQGFEFTLDAIEGLGEPIEPFVGNAEMQIPWTVRCNGPSSTPPLQPTGTVAWAVEAPPGVRVTGSMEEAIVLPRCHEVGYLSGVSKFDVEVDDTVPAMQDMDILMTATLRWDEVNPVGDNASVASSEHPVQADYLGIIGVEAPETIGRAPPGAHSEMPLYVTNLGNGETVVRFSVQEQAPRGTLVLPAPLVLEPGATGELTVHYEHPADPNDVTIIVRAVPHFAGDENRTGDTVEIPMLFIDREGRPPEFPSGADAPAPAGLLGLAVLVGVARRASRSEAALSLA